MFKKLKDKLAEEVKSSPQRIQQFAQAAQAAVTSASSSISDITNSELFSIGDNDTLQSRPIKGSLSDHKSSTSTFQDVSLIQPGSLQTSNDSMDFVSAQDLSENQRQRRLSNSSFASDVSFRLPSYESPSMYHLQSDMEVSASEAEGSGFSSGNVSLDRVTKEQIYAAYRRTQERYTKYRTQYADLARHYKLLERENAKARSVLVETQDKALRRISELREQCSLEQSAKAHLEKALRVEIEERNLKIDTLNTKIQFLQKNIASPDRNETNPDSFHENNRNVQLISFDGENNSANDEQPLSETQALNTKIEKLEKLLNKYKDSLKSTKEKSAQLTTEIQMLSGELETKNKEIELLKANTQQLDEAKRTIQELSELNEELQNKINVYDFHKNKEVSTLEFDLQKAQEELTQLQSKIDVFSKREEEYAISLAENKLSIHKELESKETEIKSLKDHLAESKQEIHSLDIVLSDYKNNIIKLEEECTKLKNDINELNISKIKITELESQIQVLTQKCQALENLKLKADEEYKCLQLQLKQETAEKLAMIDRNTYLENRNTQLSEENAKKSLQINALDKELQIIKIDTDKAVPPKDNLDRSKLIEEIDMWKKRCSDLESEIQEEREELGKLQSEIENLLINDEHIQIKNAEFNSLITKLKSENQSLREMQLNVANVRPAFQNIIVQIKDFKRHIALLSSDVKSIESLKDIYFSKINEVIDDVVQRYKFLDEQTIKQNLANASEQERILEQFNVAKEENLKLKTAIKEMELQTNELNEKLRQISKEREQYSKELFSMQNEMKKVTKQISEYESRCKELQNTTDQYKNEQDSLKQKLSNMTEMMNNSENGENFLKRENEMLSRKLEKINTECEQLKIIINQNYNEQTILNKNIADMAEKINGLEFSIESIQSEKQQLAFELEEANEKCKKFDDIINHSNNDQTILKDKLDNLEHNIELIKSQKLKLAAELEESNAKCEILQDIVNRNNNEQTILKEKINILDNEVAQLKNSKNVLEENVVALKQENLASIERKYVDDKEHIEKLQQKINDLTEENISLKSQSKEITNSIKDLEVELRDVRKSHAEMEIEKDHLNSVIEQLERKGERECLNKNTQTTNEDIEQQSEGGLKQNSNENETKKTFEDILNENDTLKEENKRFQSDVAGLQAYLAKISKENGVLNDKLRELIATSGNSQDNAHITDLSNEVQQGKDRLHDLIRENNLLLEENLELKDQLNSQHYAENEFAKSNENDKEMEYLTLKEKYTSLLDINKRLEKRMLDLEQMSQSADGNVSQMQQHNEKLRLTNEKLEQRLDEALVSLRHLHALQENTELEYLKNILYEYLTGTGAHSVTLAKVLAAVVKFDKNQTDAVLQKEKERQGFLRQLGLL